MFNRLLIAVTFLGLVAQAQATTFYVSTGGLDSRSCSTATNINTPKRNIMGASGGLACLTAGAGDFLEIRGGTYNEDLNTNNQNFPSGTSYSNAATIRAFAGETVLIRSMNIVQSHAYIIFEGLIVDGNISGGLNQLIAVGGTAHHIRLTNMEGRNNAAGQIIEINQSVSFVHITGGRFHTAIGNPQAVPSGGYCIYNKGSDGLFEYAEFYNCTGYGIHNYLSGTGSTPSRNVYRFNKIFSMVGGSGYAAGVGLLLGTGDGNQAYNNSIYSNTADGVQISNFATNTKFQNNTVVGNNTSGLSYGGVVWGTGSATTIQNNIVYQNLSTGGGGITDFADAMSPAFGGPGSVQTPTFGGNHCTNAGAGCATSGNPGFSSGAHTLASGSPLENAGIDAGLPCNGGCAVGAFDPPVLIQVDVGTAGANKITLTFDNDAGQPLRTASSFTAGWTALKTTVNNPITSAALIGNAVIQLTMQNNYSVTDSCFVSYVQASGGLTDSINIGGSLNQPFLSRSSVPCVNNVTGGGGSTPVLTQLSYRVRELYGSETGAGWKAAENTPYDVVVAGAARLRTKGKAETAAPAAFNAGFQKRITLPGGIAGAKTTLTDTCSPTDLACFFGLGTALGVANNTPTTEQLASTTANANGIVLLQNSTPNMQPGINTEWEIEIAVKLDPSLPKGSKVEIFMTRDGGAEFESYPANSIATLNVIDNQFIDGG